MRLGTLRTFAFKTSIPNPRYIICNIKFVWKSILLWNIWFPIFLFKISCFKFLYGNINSRLKRQFLNNCWFCYNLFIVEFSYLPKSSFCYTANRSTWKLPATFPFVWEKSHRLRELLTWRGTTAQLLTFAFAELVLNYKTECLLYSKLQSDISVRHAAIEFFSLSSYF